MRCRFCAASRARARELPKNGQAGPVRDAEFNALPILRSARAAVRVKRHVSDVCSLSILSRHGGGLYPLAALAAPSAAPDLLFADIAAGAVSYRVIADRWPQARQADGSRTCARCQFRAGTVVVFIRWRRWRRRAPRRIFFLLISPLAELRGGRRRLPAAAAS